MKVRESGMPGEKRWEEFFEPQRIYQTPELKHNVLDVAEFGCVYGTFTIPPSKVIKGKVFAIDIEAEMIKRVAKRANEGKSKSSSFL